MNQSVNQTERKKNCINCGAGLKYKPGSIEINCEYCGHIEKIETVNDFEELELYPYLKELGGHSHSQEISVLTCKQCGANQHSNEHIKSLHCVYCSEPLILSDAKIEQWILPGAILPFQFTQKDALTIFKSWTNKLWWTPNKFKKATLSLERLKGVYLPFWTFDAKLFATYTGQRGTYYYEFQRYTDASGKTKTRRVRKTRWNFASGQVSGFIDDTLINASKPKSKELPVKITRWDLKKLQPFHQDFLAGFITEKYTLSLQNGHLKSKEKAYQIADNWCRQDIGGDTQNISSIDMQLSEETFKHVLLPVYVCSYVYQNKLYNVYINGENKLITGQRPYSFWKIFLAILGVISLMGIIFILTKS